MMRVHLSVVFAFVTRFAAREYHRLTRFLQVSYFICGWVLLITCLIYEYSYNRKTQF